MNRTIIATLIAYHTKRDATAEPTQLIFRPRAMGKTWEYRQALGRGMRSGIHGLMMHAKTEGHTVKADAWRKAYRLFDDDGWLWDKPKAWQGDALHRNAETMAELWQQQFNELVSKGESGLVVSRVHDELIFSGADVSGWPQDRAAYADFIMDKDGVMTMVNCRYSKD